MAQGAGLLLLTALLVYLPPMLWREVRSREALYATVAEEMIRSGTAWRLTVHGDPVQSYPGYAWLVALGQEAGLTDTLALRLPAFLSVLGLAALCGVVGFRRGGPTAGLVAAAMVLFNPASLRVGCRAQHESLLALLLAGAWMAWYSFGQRRKQWAAGWAGAMLLVLLATFTAGARALAVFYLPFLFLRRPVRGRQRLLLASHLVVLGVTIAAVVVWLRHVPDQTFLPWNALSTLPEVTISYPLEILLFPFKCLLYLMPWPFLAWPAFCMAYRPLERSPVAFHYLRTITASAFIAAWVIPKVSPLVLLPVLGPLSIMTGLHAELLFRRHGRRLHLLSTALSIGAVVLSGVVLLAALLHLSGVAWLDGLGRGPAAALAGLFVVLLGVGLLAWRGALRRLPVLAHLVLGFAVVSGGILSVRTTVEVWAGGEMRAAGRALAGQSAVPSYLLAPPPALPEAAGTAAAPTPPTGGAAPGGGPNGSPAVVYRPLAESVIYRQTRSPHLGVCFYLDRPVRRVDDPRTQIPLPLPGPRPPLGDLVTGAAAPPEGTAAAPVYRDAIYALCDSGPPVVPEVDWVPLTPPLDLLGRRAVRLEWFPERFRLLRLYTTAAAVPADHQPDVVRLYRGVRR